MKKHILNTLMIISIFLLVIKGKESITYAKDALNMCYEIIIPSLFPFFICSEILVYSGFTKTLSKAFSCIMKPLFNINSNGSPAFVMSLVSGYPTGAAVACQLYEGSYLSKSETERLLSFCNNTGPLFILTAVGVGLFGDIKIGIILYIAHVTGAILVGITMRFYNKDKFSAPYSPIDTVQKSYSEIFTDSIIHSVNSILIICGTILYFSVMSRLLLDIIPIEIPPLIYGLFEMSSGTMRLCETDLPLFLKMIEASVIVGFAGLCVHAQVLAIVKKYNLSMLPYIIGKTMHGVYSAIITFVILYYSGLLEVSEGTHKMSLSLGVMSNCIYLVIAIIIIVLLLLMKGKSVENES